MKRYIRYIIPNTITLIRIILTIIFIALLNNEICLEVKDKSIIYLVIIFLAICATDFGDGRSARYLKGTSIFGGYFDVIADFIFILSSTLTLVRFERIPIWFLLVIIIKLIDFFVTSNIINNFRLKRDKVFIFDYIGRGAAVLFYGLPITVVFMDKYFIDASTSIILFLLCVTTIIAIISSTQRIIMCLQE